MTCPNCKCPECAKVELNAVLSRHLARETNLYHEPASQTNSVEFINSQSLSLATEQSAWRDTFFTGADIIFQVGDDFGIASDPHAEQLAADVVRECGKGFG